MRHLFWIFVAFEFCLCCASLDFTRLPSLPDREGFASPFCGVSGGGLIAAGGANFPGRKPWEGGTKVWYDSIFFLERPDASWRMAGRLPRACAYGASLTTPRGIACLGGGNATEHFTDCFLLRWNGSNIVIEPLPKLPRPCAFMTAALLDNRIYVAGGTEKPDSTNALHSFWSLDLSASRGWRELDAWPGPGRILATAGAADGSVFVFGGASLAADSAGKPVRTWLSDAYRFTPEKGWTRLADLPRPCVGAASPAISDGGGRLLLIGGDDGSYWDFKPEAAHPGFPREILGYDTARNRWERRAGLPFSRATVPAVSWLRHVVIVSGEVRPGYRSPEVWWAPLERN